MKVRYVNNTPSPAVLFSVDPMSKEESDPMSGEERQERFLPPDTSDSFYVPGGRPGTELRIKDANTQKTLYSYVARADTGTQGVQFGESPQTFTLSISDVIGLRKNQVTLTDPEKRRFIDALFKLKAEIKPGNTLSTYDMFVKVHDDAMKDGYAHRGPAFLPWHREYLKRFELELQRIAATPGMGGPFLPYWDWTIDQTPLVGRWPFTADFLGGDGDPGADNKVVDGPFADRPERNAGAGPAVTQWKLIVMPHDAPPEPRNSGERAPYLRRQLGRGDPDVRSLPSWDDVETTLDATPYDSAPWDRSSRSGFRNLLEGSGATEEDAPKMHNRVHGYIGGTMGPPTSPYDPVFWLHHCYIDKLWAYWQRVHQNEPGFQPYLPDGGARAGHNLRDRMQPWNKKAPKDVLNILELGYQYE
jgi:tyrosinase